MSEQQPTAHQIKQTEYNNLRMNTLLETVSAQRTDALNQVANLTADKAVVEKALKDTLEANNAANNRIVHLTDTVASLERQVSDLQAALAEAHSALRNQSAEENTVRDAPPENANRKKDRAGSTQES